jgi:hypothetical protein
MHYSCLLRRELSLLRAATFDIPPVRSKPTHEKQYDEDDQDDADDTDIAVDRSRSRSRRNGH